MRSQEWQDPEQDIATWWPAPMSFFRVLSGSHSVLAFSVQEDIHYVNSLIKIGEVEELETMSPSHGTVDKYYVVHSWNQQQKSRYKKDGTGDSW